MIDICRGLSELVQHSSNRGSLQQRKGAASHLIDLFGYFACYPSGKEGGLSHVQIVRVDRTE
jgi:hypothetical protein